jgi:outer membrane protein assembly factor BamB
MPLPLSRPCSGDRSKQRLAALFALGAALTPNAVRAAAPPASAPGPSASTDVVTFHYGNDRLGWNPHESVLTPAAVSSARFGALWQTPLDGYVYGSPLYVPRLAIGGQTRPVVFAATDHNSVFALDGNTGQVLWARRVLAPPITQAQFNGSWYGDTHTGFLSTPVIDRKTGTIYACGVRGKGLQQQYLVWALDLSTGATRPGWPVVLHGTYKGTRFIAGEEVQRGALILVNDWVYVPFGGRQDIPPWHGWIIGVNTAGAASGPQRAFCTAPKSDGAGVWSGGGLSADDRTGALYAVTGNGDYDLDRGGDNLAQSIFRLIPQGDRIVFRRTPDDFFTAANHKFLDIQDEDLGGSTAILLPDQPGTSTPHLLFTGGKDGLAYLVNRDRLGGIGSALQADRLFANPKATYHEGIRATSCYFDAGDAGRFIYVAGDQPGPDGRLGMVALQLVGGSPERYRQVWTLKTFINNPNSPVVSSDGPTGGIVWLVEAKRGDDSTLHAYDALTGNELYNSDSAPGKVKLTGGRRFTSATVADGRVYVGAAGLYCYGLADDLGGHGTAGQGGAQ